MARSPAQRLPPSVLPEPLAALALQLPQQQPQAQRVRQVAQRPQPSAPPEPFAVLAPRVLLQERPRPQARRV
jgi:hypothetical protein